MIASVKNVVVIAFMCQLLNIFICNIAHFVMYKNQSMRKSLILILSFYIFPLKNQKLTFNEH